MSERIFNGKHGRMSCSVTKVSMLLLLVFFTAGSLFSQTLIINNPGKIRIFNNYTFNTDVLIKSGCFVDFRGTIKVATGKTITIEKGAVLRIKNATVTHTTDNMSNTTNTFWGGIVIQGNNVPQDGDQKRLCMSQFNHCMDIRNNMEDMLGENCLGSAFGTFVNGALYLDNAGIRYSAKGIQVTTGGLLYARNSSFVNNLLSVYLKAMPQTFVQRSLIQSNTFTTDFRNSNSNWVQHMMIEENYNVYFPISSNTFTNTQVNAQSETYHGIFMIYSAAEIRSNTFQNLLCALFVHQFGASAKTKKISYNTINDCYAGVWTVNGHAVNISYNTINPATFNNARGQSIYGTTGGATQITGNYPIGILNTNALTVTNIKNNILKSNVLKKNEIGILDATSAYGPPGTYTSQANEYYKNRISKMYINYQSQYYPYPNQTVISASQLSCNTFEGQCYTGIFSSLFGRTYRDIYVTASHSMMDQGSMAKSAENIFSSTPLCAGFSHIYNAGALFKYYYRNQQPTLTTNVSRIQSNPPANSCPDPTLYYELAKYFCDPFIIIITPGGISTAKATIRADMNTYRTTMTALEAGGVTPAEKEEYNYATHQYDAGLMKLLEVLNDEIAADTVDPVGHEDSIANCLAAHSSFAGKYYMIAHALDVGNYALAEQYANMLVSTWYPGEPASAQLREYVYLLTDYQTEPAATKKTWLSGHFSQIKSIGDNPAHAAAGMAQSWAQYIADTDEENAYHGQIIYPAYILVDPTYTEEPPPPLSENVVVFPNPFNEMLNVSVTNPSELAKTYTIELLDLNNVMLQAQTLTVNPTMTQVAMFSTSSLAPGYYAIRVTAGSEVSSSLVYKE